jgi:hypothetical protein
MDSRRTTWITALALAALALSVAACSGVELRRPLIAYDFDNPILNEQWMRAHHDPLPPARAPKRELAARTPESEPEPAALAAQEPSGLKPLPKKEKQEQTQRETIAASPRGAAAKPLPLATAGEQVPIPAPMTWEEAPVSPPVVVVLPDLPEPVVGGPSRAESGRVSGDSGRRDAPPTVGESGPEPPPTVGESELEAPAAAPSPEVADAAGRLVGIRSSFDQDTFLKHVLFVSNVALDDAPGEGLLRWVWKQYGKAGAMRLEPGHLVFLGWGKKARVVGVVESVDAHGTAQFVTVQGDEVKRLTITPGKPRARRDERSGRILNSAVGKGRLAGECLMGSVAVVPDASGSSALATAE